MIGKLLAALEAWRDRRWWRAQERWWQANERRAAKRRRS